MWIWQLRTHCQEKHKDSRGQGNLTTFLSKTTVNKIITIFENEIKLRIANEVKEAGNSSVQIDSTQDISVVEQFSIIVRYIDIEGKVKERLLDIVPAQISTGLALKTKLIFVLNNLDLDKTKIIGCSFDGAANISGVTKGSANRGNYMDLLSFISKYDDTIKSHFIDSKTFRGTLNRIQNDLIKCTADVVMDHIKSEIKKAPFVSNALDETTDVANLSQLSIVVRYVLDGIPQERFLGFLDVTSERTVDALFKIVCDIISSLECGSKRVAQSYDGAAVMAGYLGGLQTKMKEKFKHAIFVHCIAYRLNLVLSRSMDNIKDCKFSF
ncbi:unnamed protein product [Psylliodes chrysocephalus]|uniref:DUF4371 domain-containing protein n=1 Tax=Psylliodes chrysocephalus TaxID=3402493 RepID=A0A9P0GDV4_9CUCU|nr:unnamed protein product [Psylliodes chrysocephala]